MTGNKCLLDTSVIIHSFRRNNTISERLNAIAEIYVPVGKPIPENDIWIATMARQYDLPLFTTDNHFAEIDHLSLLQ